MLAKNILGAIILVFNAAGLGFLIYTGFTALMDHFFSKEEENTAPVPAQKEDEDTSFVIDEDIIPDDDELLKNMDLSDLDNLNLDDFE